MPSCPFAPRCSRLTLSIFLSCLPKDPPQFLAHFYHWAAEGIFGLWRTFSALDPRSIQPDGHVDATRIGRRVLGFGSSAPDGDDGQGMSMPRRMIFTHTAGDKWQDYSGMNALLVRPLARLAALTRAQDAHLTYATPLLYRCRCAPSSPRRRWRCRTRSRPARTEAGLSSTTRSSLPTARPPCAETSSRRRCARPRASFFFFLRLSVRRG